MKIAFFTDTFLPQVNGVATALANQARILGERGHQVVIFTPKLDDIKREKFKAQNVTLVSLPTVPALLYPEYKLGILGLFKVIKYLKKFNPDVLHLHTPLTIGMDAVMAAKILKKPLVGTVHIYFTESEYLRSIRFKLAAKALSKLSIPFVNFLYAQCNTVLIPSKSLTEELKLSGFKKPLIHFPNGVILKKPNILSASKKQEIKKKYHLKQKVILHLGRLSEEKNIDIVIKAFAQVVKTNPNVSLLIIGDGPSAKKLKQLTQNLGLEKEVVFTGFIEHEKLLSSGLISLGDLFATASTSENQPMALLEVMVFGLPMVGVDHPGLTELISSNGLVVQSYEPDDLAKAMQKVLQDQNLAKKMSNSSFKKVKNYSIEKVVDKLLKIYSNLS